MYSRNFFCIFAHKIVYMLKELLKKLLHTTLTWCALLLLMLALWACIQLPSISGPLDSLFESFHVEDLYTYWTRDAIAKESSDVQSDLVLVDVAGIETRGELATLFNEMADAEPRAVVLDMIFAPLSMADSAQDHQLVSALQRFPRLILASHCHSDMQGTHQERSFFVDSLPNAVEGEAWLPGSVVRTFSPIIEESGRPSLAYQVAEALELNVTATTEEQSICYLPVSVFTWTPSKESLNMEYLKDKVVMIGDVQDLRDFHNVPLLTQTNGRMAGVMIHLASVLTMAAERPIHHMPKWLNVLIELVLLWLLCLLFCSWTHGLDNWYQAITAFVMSALLMGVGACIFVNGHCIVSMLIFLVGCPLAGFAKDVADKVMP